MLSVWASTRQTDSRETAVEKVTFVTASVLCEQVPGETKEETRWKVR